MSEKPSNDGPNWQSVIICLAVLLFLSFICTNGWGRFS